MKSTIEAALLALALAGPAFAGPAAITVTATTETEGTRGDADDPAIWVNPADPATSLILGTDKTWGLFVYDLAGRVVDFLADGKLNNVDLRPFRLAGRDVVLVGATRRDDDTLAFYILENGKLTRAEPHLIPALEAAVPGLDDIYGFAMAQDAAGTYALANFKSGDVLQWRIGDADGRLTADLVRAWKVGTQPEGMVADDRAGHIYVGEEDRGIWRYPLSPTAPPVPFEVASIPSDCLPKDDVEGLAIHDGAEARYLVASAQGIHRAALFRLDGEARPECTALVEVAAGTVDGVTETDGLAVTALPAGPEYPQGLLVMMDDQNAGFTTGFKLIDWSKIAAELP